VKTKTNLLYFFSLIALTIILFISCNKDKNNNDDKSNNSNNQIQNCGSATDADGNVYNTVIIGNQCWFKENLNTKKYNNGDLIETTNPPSLNLGITAFTTDTLKYQWAYAGIEANADIYGRLYTWYVITDSRGICPNGWRVSTQEDWATLTAFLGGEGVAGNKLREVGHVHWLWNGENTTNESGFTALPGGLRNPTYFEEINNWGRWWTSTDSNTGTNLAYERKLANGSAILRTECVKNYGLSVRCIKE